MATVQKTGLRAGGERDEDGKGFFNVSDQDGQD